MNLLTDEQVLKKIKNRFFGYTQDAHCDYMLDFMTDILQQNKHQKSCEAILDRIFYYHIDEGEKLSSQNNQETLQFISDNYNRYKPYMTNKTASTFIARAKYTFNRVNPILLDCISSFEIEWRSQNQLRTKLKNAKLNQTDCQKILKSITHYITKKHNTDYINQSYSTIRTRLIEKIYELNNTQETATSLLNPTWNEIQYNYLQSLKLNIKTRIKSRDILKERLGSYRFNYDIPSTKVTINSKGKPVVITNENKIKLYTDNMELNNCKDIDYKPQLFTYLKTNYPEKYKEFKQTNQEDNVKNFIEFANLKESILPSQTFNPI